jgi:hypothetical protein
MKQKSDEETAAKIRKGLIRHVSVDADYDTLDITAGGKVPHSLHNAEMPLVAVLLGLYIVNYEVKCELQKKNSQPTGLLKPC